MSADVPPARRVRVLLSLLSSSPGRVSQLYCLYRCVRWWVEARGDADGSGAPPLSVLSHWARLDRDTTADRLEELELWGLLVVKRVSATRSTPPGLRYRLGDMTTLRSGIRAWCKIEGIGAGMGDVILEMARLGEDRQGVPVSFGDT